MQLSKVTYALVAAGLIGGVATFYHQSTPAGRRAALGHAALRGRTQAVVPTAAANLPDFTALVDRVGPAVVNISVVHDAKAARPRRRRRRRRAETVPRILQALRRRMPDGPRHAAQQPSQGMGSGFIVSHDGFIVTNAHVVDGASEVTVKLTDRREFTAKVIGADKRTDIALIKIDAKNLPALDIAAKPACGAANGSSPSARRSASRTAYRRAW